MIGMESKFSVLNSFASSVRVDIVLNIKVAGVC